MDNKFVSTMLFLEQIQVGMRIDQKRDVERIQHCL